MNAEQMVIFQGEAIIILEMTVKNSNEQLELSWIVSYKGLIYKMMFYNVSRLRIENMSAPLGLQGFEIINHKKKGWERESAYEIRDFENDHINFFCECFEFNEL